MKTSHWLAAAAIAFNLAGVAAAAPCFAASGIPLDEAPAAGIDCTTERAIYWRPKQDEVLARDGAGGPLFKAYMAPAKKKNGNGLKAIADMTGRRLTPAEFETVYVITPTLGVGERQIEAKDPKTGYKLTRAFLIDLTTGEIRATPYRTIFYSKRAPGVTDPAYLLGVLELDDSMRPSKAAILSPGGTETGLVVKSDWHPVLTNRHGMLSVDKQLFTASGEPPAGGRPLYDTIFDGIFAEIGTAPAELSAAPLPLYAPLNNVGQLQELPENVLGYIRGGGGRFWQIRRENGTLRYYEHPGGPPIITNQPVGKGWPGLYVSDHSDVVKTDDGWMNRDYRVPFPTAQEASADTDAKLNAFIAAMWADIAEQERAAEQAAIDAQQERIARAAAERETVLARIDQAAKESWQGYRLQDLKRDVIRFQLEGRYEAAGLYVDPEMRREVCWSRQSIICNYSASTTPSSGSGYVSTWEKAFENASALNQRQYQERCATAFNGYGALCTSD